MIPMEIHAAVRPFSGTRSVDTISAGPRGRHGRKTCAQQQGTAQSQKQHPLFHLSSPLAAGRRQDCRPLFPFPRPDTIACGPEEVFSLVMILFLAANFAGNMEEMRK
jgi:hypothetical protein